MTVDWPPRVLASNGALLVRSGRICPSLVLANGAALHDKDVGASSIVWHADRPNTKGKSKIRSWDVRYTNANDPHGHATMRRQFSDVLPYTFSAGEYRVMQSR
jgi:hypothetical protein